jgi:hypothetical protein
MGSIGQIVVLFVIDRKLRSYDFEGDFWIAFLTYLWQNITYYRV